MNLVLRSNASRVLTVVIAVLCAISLASLTAQYGPADGLRFAPWLALVAGSCWAVFWRPCVIVGDGGVTFVNVFRTVTLPWPSIELVDTKWGLTLVTAYGRFQAWAAPAPGARATLRAHRAEGRNLPESTYAGGTVRPGDLSATPSGGAALVVRERWEALRDAGHLNDPRLEHDRAPVSWHWPVIVAGVGLSVLSLLTLVL